MATLDGGLSARTPKPFQVPVVAPGHTPATVTDQINNVILQRTPRWWIHGRHAAWNPERGALAL